MKHAPLSVNDYPTDASLYVFDFCGTLFDSNTSLDFINWLANRHQVSAWAFMSSRLRAGLGRRLAGFTPAQHIQCRSDVLRGLTQTVIDKEADAFVAEYLHNCRRPAETAFFHWCLDQGKEVILLSFSYEFLLSAYSSQLSQGPSLCLGSTMEMREGSVLSGRYELQMHTYGKLKRLLEHYERAQIEQACFVTDDVIADHDLLDVVKYPFCGVEQ